jgi:hypothetical protein
LQTTVLERLADDLDERVRRLESASGHLTVLDTGQQVAPLTSRLAGESEDTRLNRAQGK